MAVVKRQFDMSFKQEALRVFLSACRTDIILE